MQPLPEESVDAVAHKADTPVAKSDMCAADVVAAGIDLGTVACHVKTPQLAVYAVVAVRRQVPGVRRPRVGVGGTFGITRPIVTSADIVGAISPITSGSTRVVK